MEGKPVVSVGKIFTFSAAHRLPWHEGECRELHGHTWKVEVIVTGHIQNTGVVIEFRDLKRIVAEKTIDKLDHTFLNSLGPDFHNPTAENICSWILDQIESEFHDNISEVSARVWESDSSWVEINRVIKR